MVERRNILLLVFFLNLSFCFCNGQEKTSLSGIVVEETKGDPVEGAIVMVKEPANGRVLSYAMTREDGKFSLSFVSPGDSVLVSVSSMTIEPLSFLAASNAFSIEVRVKYDVKSLREVKVVAHKVEQKGDTLNYNVSSFSDATDRSIGDVLKKLPGIKVDNSGRIYYQGLEISKFYIEGMDLLQGRYGLASSNIDASKVATVQVLENHQPIRILEGVEVPENAAINLKLRKSAAGAFFLTAQAGMGLPSLLMANELIGMRFSSKQQNLLMYKGDNTGRDIIREMTSYYGLSSSPVLEVFSLEDGGVPALDRQHSLFNNSNIVSANDLRVLGKDATLTTNVNFFSDKQNGNRYFGQDYLVKESGELVHINESVSSFNRINELSGSMTLEKNTASSYLRNRSDFGARWNSGEENIISGDEFYQRLSQPSVSAENELRLIKGNNTVTSKAVFSSQDYVMSVSPVLLPYLTEFSDVISQKFLLRAFRIDAGYRRRVRFSRYLTAYFGGEAFAGNHSLESDILAGVPGVPVGNDSLINDLSRFEIGSSFSMRFLLNKNKWHLNINLPLALRKIRLHDEVVQSHGYDRTFILPSPTLSVEYQINAPLLLRLDSAFGSSLSGIKDDMGGYFMSSYRTLSRNTGELPRSDVLRMEGMLSFKQPSSSTFAYLSFSYSKIWRNTLPDLVYSGSFCTSRSLPMRNSGEAKSVNLNVSTAISSLSTIVGMDVLMRRSGSVALFQGALSEYTNDLFRIQPSLTSTLFHGAAVLKWNASWNMTSSLVGEVESEPLNNLRHSLSLTVVPIKGGTVSFSGNHYLYRSGVYDSSIWFGNVSLRYKRAKTEFILDWNNIFGTSEFAMRSYDGICSYSSVYELRPMELLLRVRFSIL